MEFKTYRELAKYVESLEHSIKVSLDLQDLISAKKELAVLEKIQAKYKKAMYDVGLLLNNRKRIIARMQNYSKEWMLAHNGDNIKSDIAFLQGIEQELDKEIEKDNK